MIDTPGNQNRKPDRNDNDRVPAKGDIPPTGALDKDDIKSVDLEPRSNGETEWQDERPRDERPQK